MSDGIMASVIMTSYNHEKYIRKALESVLAQKTDFGYEMLIHDDASTDGTADIIREYSEKYPDIIKPVFEEANQWSRGGNITRIALDREIRGRYIAILETDDYWDYEYKLQTQVDFMETHEDYSMCMHAATRLDDVTGETAVMDFFEKEGTYGWEDQVKAGLGTTFPAVASYLLRAEFLKDIPDLFLDEGLGDYALRQYWASRGRVYYFEKPMSVYRVSMPSSYMGRLRGDDAFYREYTLRQIRFFERYNEYTGKRFAGILGRKIDSDYFGFCSATEMHDGLEMAGKAGLDEEKIKKCYGLLSIDSVDESMKRFCGRYEHVFIYGISRLGLVCKKQLDHAGIAFDGFVVTDGQRKPDEAAGKKVYFLSEAMAVCGRTGFLLGVQMMNSEAIIGELERNGITDYYYPYDLERRQ